MYCKLWWKNSYMIILKNDNRKTLVCNRVKLLKFPYNNIVLGQFETFNGCVFVQNIK